MDIKFNYNDTISTVNSKKPEVVDLETKDPVLLKSNKSADTVLPISPNDTTINTDDIITSSDKQYTVEVTNPEDPHVIGHTRNFYRGRSFRFAGIWTKGVHYICDEYVVDFVVKDNTLLACSKSHMSTSENEPVDFVYKDNHMVGVVSDYWDFVLTGAAGKTGGVYLPSYDEENDQLVWTLITENLDDTVYTPLGLKVQIDKALAPIVSDVDILKDGITSLNLVTTRISSDVTGLEQRVENAEGNIGQLRLDADAFDVRMSDAEGNIGQLALTAREFSVEMSNIQGDVGRLLLTAQEFGVRMSNAEGDVSLLKQTADEIQTRVENAEGDISQINQRADEIWTQVENNQGDISRISQRADSIESTVQNAQGDISQLKQTATEISTRVENNEGDISRISQRADAIESTVENAQGDISQLRQTATEISSTVATNKELADGAIAENRSLISQTAEEIRSEVESNVTRLGGEIEQNRSEIRQTAEEITSTVERNKQETDGAIESAKSEFKQTADEISATVERNKADADGAIETARSEIRQTADAITSTVEANKRAVDGSILELNSTITQTAEEIRAEVARVETDVNGNIEDAKSEMKQTADEISATVARNKAESDGSFQSVSSQLSIQADQIQSTVDSIESVEDRVTTSESNITQLSDEISTKVSQTDFNTKTQQIESSVSAIDQKADGIRASVTTLSGTVDNNARAFSDYATATDAELVEMQRQLDGAIESWFYEGVPTLNNVPASNWTTVEDKNVHLGDLYYDKLTGYAYRFMHDETNGYYWTRIEDSDITLALENAAKAQDTADNKRRVFLTQPKPPYDAGDLWVQGHTANNDGVIFRCVNSRESGTFISSDWELASDSVTSKIARSNFEVLSNAIVGTVSSYTYDSNGVLDSATQSRISQTADAIRLSVSNGAIGTALGTNGAINSALLDTGIDITNGDITLTANHIKLQNQNAVSGLELVTTGSGSSQRVVIDVSSLNVSGIFTTQAWSGTNGVRAGIISDANTYANTVAGNAQTNAINDTRSYVNSTDYLNNSVVPLITNATSGLAKDSDYNYLKAALLDGTTTVAGGLVLSSLIKLGYNAGTDEIPDWQIMSGINGVAVPTEPGKGIAAWYGGAMEDGEKSGASANAAKSLFRMDGSGYLSSGRISWDDTGSLYIDKNVVVGDNNETLNNLVQMLSDFYSWFEEVPIVIDGVNRKALHLKTGTDVGLAGLYADGFISAAGLSTGGGTSGIDLAAMWGSLTNNPADAYASTKIAAAHIPDLSGTYLPLTGGTIHANDFPLVIKTDSAIGAWNGIHFIGANNQSLGYYVMGANGYSGPFYVTAGQTASYRIWHEGIFSPSNYLARTGGEMSGTIDIASSTNVGLQYIVDTTWGSWDRCAVRVNAGGNFFNFGAYGDTGANITYGYVGESYSSSYAIRIYPSANPQVGTNVIWHAGNDGANSGLDADLLDGKHAGTWASTAANVIPIINSGGVMEVGKCFDFHNVAGESSDFSCRLTCNGNNGNEVYLPTGSGTLALTSGSVGYLDYHAVTSSDNCNRLLGCGVYAWSDANDPANAYGTNSVMLSICNYRPDCLQIAYSANSASVALRFGHHIGSEIEGWSSWNTILTGENYSSFALPLSGGTIRGSLSVTSELSVSSNIFLDSLLAFGTSSSVSGYLNCTSAGELRWYDQSDWRTVYHSGNSNLSTVPWSCSFLNAASVNAAGSVVTPCIELQRMGSSAGYGGYIDFHYNDSSADYTSRIIEDGSGSININDRLWVKANGCVGVMNNSPTYSLDIGTGQVRVSDYYEPQYVLSKSSSNTNLIFGINSSNTGYIYCTNGTVLELDLTYKRTSFKGEIEWARARILGTSDNWNLLNTCGLFAHQNYDRPANSYGYNEMIFNCYQSARQDVWQFGMSMNDDRFIYRRGTYNGNFSEWRFIYDSHNANRSDVSWACSTLTASGNIEATGTIHSSTGIWSEGYVSAGGLASSSDERLKSGIKDFGYSAEMLMALRPREWDWNEKSYMKGHAAGVVAQELQRVMPYAIVEQQYLSVNYDMLHAVEIAGLQDHEKRIKELEDENKRLKELLKINEYANN